MVLGCWKRHGDEVKTGRGRSGELIGSTGECVIVEALAGILFDWIR